LRNSHHNYSNAAEALERGVRDTARDWGKIARGDTVLSSRCDPHPAVLEAAGNLEQMIWQDAERCRAARELYDEIRDRPLAEIILVMCEQGYCDHARYILTGDWAEGDVEGLYFA
jgi:hypothetical protein